MAEAFSGYILVIDDVQFMRRQLCRMISSMGYDVLDSAEGAHAIRTMQLDPPSLVILDQVMPRMSGSELCHWIRANDATRNVPVIVCTAAQDKKTLEKVFKAGASSILIKPVTKEKLRERIERHLQATA
jgi:CheY-like chemotaxis protein